MIRSEFLQSMGALIFANANAAEFIKTPEVFSEFLSPVESICDYTKSFVTHVMPNKANQARIQVESRCIVVNSETGKTSDYFKFASCKSENTYAKDNLFMDPNYDFSGVYNSLEYVIFRSNQFSSARYAEREMVQSRFQSIRVEVQKVKRFKKLDNNREVVLSTLKRKSLVGRTTFFRNEFEKIILEYPIKTMNVNDIDWIYQVDTGPIALPHPNRKEDPILKSLELAFIAFNKKDQAYVVINSPTPIPNSQELLNNHYSEIIEINNVENEIYEV